MAATRPEIKENGLTLRALLVALGLTFLAGLWVKQSEVVVLSTQITESVPAIPGLAALVLLLFVNGVMRRIPGAKPFTRAELLVVFLFVTVSSTMMGIGIMQYLIALIVIPFYFNTDEIPANRPYLPEWLAPHDTTVIRHLYESAPDGRVPWHIWWKPGLIWLGFFLALWWTMHCMMALFYRAWAEEEKLSFPLVFLPVEMTGSERNTTPFFRNKLMWLGFGLAAFYNLVNITHALYPSLPAFGKQLDIGIGLTALPWSAAAPLQFHLRPEIIGLGYLVSTQISLTVWLSFALLKLISVFAASRGYEPQGLYTLEQGIGAYLVLAVMLVWLSRRHLLRVWREAISGRSADGAEGVSYREAVFGFLGGFAAIWLFMTAAGMKWWVVFVYLLVLLAVALVYGRLRAQTGVPLLWMFPYGMPKAMLLYTFGTPTFGAGSPSTLPVWALFSFLSRGYFTMGTGYQVESMELSRRTSINPRQIAFALCLALAVGFALGWFNCLQAYYHGGALTREDGIWGSWLAQPEYEAAAKFVLTPKRPQIERIWATGAGGVIVLLLWWLQIQFTGFPLHPLGYAMTCSFGGLLWGPFFLVWVLKSLALRYGGMRFYRQSVPFFLGFALGHFATAGIFWGLLGAWTGEAVKGYPVYFG